MNLVARVKGILLDPVKEWEAIKNESSSVKELFLNYAILLALIPSVAGFIGQSFLAGAFNTSIGTGLQYFVITYIMSLISVFLLGYVIDLLSTSFDSTKDLTASMKVAVYASTPTWVFGILNLFPALSFVYLLAGIYSLVLLFLGLKHLKTTDKAVIFFIVVLIVFIVIYVVASFIMGIFLIGGAISATAM